MQAGKGINISARTFHLAQGDILKVTHTHTHVCTRTHTRSASLLSQTDQWWQQIKISLIPLQAKVDHHWLVFLLYLHLECIVLLLQIYDGKDNTAHVLGAFTGSSMLGLTLISTSNHLWLEFYSDPESTGEGFKLVYSSKCTLPSSINRYADTMEPKTWMRVVLFWQRISASRYHINSAIKCPLYWFLANVTYICWINLTLNGSHLWNHHGTDCKFHRWDDHKKLATFD